MIRSMTAYGRAKAVVGGKDILAEVKSVNSRYFDCNVKLPRLYGYMEGRIKSYLSERGVARGKLEVCITVDLTESAGVGVALDCALADSYLEALRQLRDRYGLRDDISVMSVAANRDLFLVKKAEADAEQDWLDVLSVLQSAVDQFMAQREREGENLRRDILEKKNRIAAIVPLVEEKSEETKAGYQQKLQRRLEQALKDQRITVDENRILTECAIFADKVAIDEETVRLRSHFDTFDQLLDRPEPVGKNLDFLLQEMNREVNTIGSKCNHLEITRLVIQMKGELEKIREQIQNIE